MSHLSFLADAVWIGSDHPFDLHEAYLNFRSPAGWQLATVPQQAKLYLTADSRYKLWINGQFVARGPARSFPDSQSVDSLDVANYLRPGSNKLVVELYQPGYSHFSYVHRGAAGLLACLLCDGNIALQTDTTWRVRRDWSYNSHVPRVSIYGSGVEDRNLNRADNWIEPTYDDSDWSAVRVVAPAFGGSPWFGLQLRKIPFLRESSSFYGTATRERIFRPHPVAGATPLSQTGRGVGGEGLFSAKPHASLTLLEARRSKYPDKHRDDPHLALREGWFSATAETIRADDQGWFSVTLAEDEAVYWLFDLGRDYTCQGWAEIKNASGQEQLAISYHEKIRNNELIISDPQTYCRVRLTDRFRLRPGAQTAETFALRGGRYLIFQLVGPTGNGFRMRPQARVVEYPLEITHPLSASDEQLAQIIHCCETTLHACLQDGFVDCVWRESSQWLGDALPQSLIMASMTDDYRPLRQVIQMAARGAYPDGVLPSVLPGEVHAYAVVDYNFTWVELLNLYWKLRGNDGLIEQLWPVLLKMLDRFDQDRNPDGLIISQPGRRLFLDWAPLSRSEPNAVYNLRYLLALQRAAQLADDRGLISDESRLWRDRAAKLQAAIRANFWHDGRWYDDIERTTISQLAASLALITGTTQSEQVQAQLEAIASRSLDLDDDPAPDKMVLASPFMHHYIFEALRQHQKFEIVIEIIRLRWGRWVEAGYPTTWENWNVDFPDGSQCHAFSAHPRYHLAEIARDKTLKVSKLFY